MSVSSFSQNDDTILALATAPGVGAIAVLRLSGKDAIDICNQVFYGKDLSKQKGYTLHFGTIKDGGKLIDEVLVSLFRGPKSFTGEDVIEISTHGSPYIVREVMRLLLHKGARLAKAGEFTQRAFLNGRFDLAQAEAVADLIAADSDMAHKAAMHQMRGGFSQEIAQLREELIHFASMIELELDFSEEDVEFASREQLRSLIEKLLVAIRSLASSFALGNVIKKGVSTVIAGKPNAGKSTLLNALLNEEKAIVSEIEGTTRDFIEDTINIEGISFRFTDTAGLRDTSDVVEAMGVARTKSKMKEASIILYLADLKKLSIAELQAESTGLQSLNLPILLIGNKSDLLSEQEKANWQTSFPEMLFISASHKNGLEELKSKLLETIEKDKIAGSDTIVTNERHYHQLKQTEKSLMAVITGLENGISNDFLAMDIRQSLHHLGEITGSITTEDLLDNIFSKFCIGK
ncbi:tRNA uridine-5-carboxymethylaminomethyl(34) synthesis GTPase MnmE [Fulvivirgaceae bacterium LMO-SS25]